MDGLELGQFDHLAFTGLVRVDVPAKEDDHKQLRPVMKSPVHGAALVGGSGFGNPVRFINPPKPCPIKSYDARPR